MAIAIGESVGHYKIVSKIGAGGMGEVYLAEDTKLDRKVAIKFLHEELSEDSDKLNRFIQEAKAASALNHPNILTVYEIGEADGNHYIATELIDGGTLRAHLASKDSMSLNAILKIGVQVAEAMSAAHQAGIIHRDIKPENIMIRNDGYAKVLDFGLAKLSERRGAGETGGHGDAGMGGQGDGEMGGRGAPGLWLARSGERDEAMRMLDHLKQESTQRFVQGLSFLLIYIGLNEKGIRMARKRSFRSFTHHRTLRSLPGTRCPARRAAVQGNPEAPEPAGIEFYETMTRNAVEIITTTRCSIVSMMYTALAAVYGQLGEQERAEAALRELHSLAPDLMVRDEYSKWLDAEITEHIMDGLRKAGLEIDGK